MSSLPPPQEKVPPHSIEAEAALLACLILNADDVLGAVSERVKPEHFYREAHRTLWNACVALHTAKSPVDMTTLVEYLKARDLLDFTGGADYLLAIHRLNPLVANCVKYGESVRDCWVRREIIRAADKAMGMAYSPGDLNGATVAQQAAESLDALRHGSEQKGTLPLQHYTRQIFLDLQKAAKGEVGRTLLPIPWSDLSVIQHAMPAGDLLFVAGRPGTGKTGLALQLGMHWAGLGYPGIFFSCEMTGDAISRRSLLQRMTGANQDDLHALEAGIGDGDRVMTSVGNAVRDTWELRLFVNQHSHPTAGYIEGEVRRAKRVHPDLAWIVVDYVQLMDTTGPNTRRNANQVEELGNLAYAMLGIAKDHGIVVVLASQLSRDCERETPKRPALHHLLGSGKLESAGTNVWGIYRPATYTRYECEAAGFPDPEAFPGLTEVRVLKQRTGGIGAAVLQGDLANCRFRDMNQVEYDALMAVRGHQAQAREQKVRNHT